MLCYMSIQLFVWQCGGYFILQFDQINIVVILKFQGVLVFLLTIKQKKIKYVCIFLKDFDEVEEEEEKEEESVFFGRGARNAVFDSRIRVRQFYVVLRDFDEGYVFCFRIYVFFFYFNVKVCFVCIFLINFLYRRILKIEILFIV